MTAKEFTIVREFNATCEQIWDAWVEPDQMAQWLPDGVSTPRESIAVDLRVGGRYECTMISTETGEKFHTGGEYIALERPHRLVMSWGNAHDSRADAMQITVRLEPAGEQTQMTFTLRGVEGRPGDGWVYDGWDQALDSMQRWLRA